MDQLRVKKTTTFLEKLKFAVFDLYDQIVASFILNGIGVIVLIILESLTLIHTLFMVHKSVSGYYLSPFYEYLQYVNAIFLSSNLS